MLVYGWAHGHMGWWWDYHVHTRNTPSDTFAYVCWLVSVVCCDNSPIFVAVCVVCACVRACARVYVCVGPYMACNRASHPPPLALFLAAL